MALMRYKPLGSAEHLYRYEMGGVTAKGVQWQALVLFCTQEDGARNAALVAPELVTDILKEHPELDPARLRVYEKYAPRDLDREWREVKFRFEGRVAREDQGAVAGVPPDVAAQLRRLTNPHAR